GKSVGLIDGHLTAAAQQFAHLVDGFWHVVVRGGFDADPVLLQFRVQLAKDRQRKDDAVIVRVFAAREHALDRNHDANHGERLPFDVDLLAQRIFGRKQLFRGAAAQHDEWRMMLVVELAEPAPGRHFEVVHVFDRGEVAFQDGVFGAAVAVLHDVGSGAKLRLDKLQGRGDGFHVGKIFHGQRVFECQFAALAHFFGRKAEVKGLNVKSKDNVGSHAADHLRDIVVQSSNHGGNADDYGHADHNAQHRQARAQLVAADGVHRH